MSSVTLLLGSGVCLSAGMPSTSDITRQVLSGQGAWRHTDERYHLSDPLPVHLPHPENVPLILSFLTSLSKVAADYYQVASGNQPSYEELYYLAQQVADCETHEYDNAAVSPLCDRLRRKLKLNLQHANRSNPDFWNLAVLAKETCSYIFDLALHPLCKRPSTTKNIAPLLRAFCKAASGGGIIATLNHDTVIETALRAIKVPYDDGFLHLTPEIARWEPTSLAAEAALRVLKLHGSVGWYWVRERGSDTPREFRARISPGANHSRLRLTDGTDFRATSARPLVLMGRHNKILNYTDEVFLSLFYRFREALDNSSSLVACGYGFGDKGINRTVLEWLGSDSSRRITIIHPDSDALRRDARPAISLNWDSWLERHQLKLVSKKLEDLRPADLNQVFTPNS